MPNKGRRGAELGFPNGQFVDGLDEVARGLAAGTISRGRAIKLGAAALLGSMGLFSLFDGKAGAQVTVQAGLCENKPAVSNRKRCPSETEALCGDCPGCFCTRTVSGRKRCLSYINFECPTKDECDSDGDCPGNKVCAQVGCTCGHPRRNVCMRPCPPADACPPT